MEKQMLKYFFKQFILALQKVEKLESDYAQGIQGGLAIAYMNVVFYMSFRNELANTVYDSMLKIWQMA